MTRVASVADTEVVLLCGGKGTRLGPLTAATPKPLLPVDETPFLVLRLQQLQREGVRRIILAVHYLAEQFHAAARALRNSGVDVQVVEEPEPLGTGGALRHAAQHVRSPLLIAMNGDSWVPQPLQPVMSAHERCARDVTMVVVRTEHVAGSAHQKDVVTIGAHDDIRGFTRWREGDAAGWVNAGIYVWRTAALRAWPTGTYGFEQRLPALVPPGRAGVFYSEAPLLDIGTPACYAQAHEYFTAADPLTRT